MSTTTTTTTASTGTSPRSHRKKPSRSSSMRSSSQLQKTEIIINVYDLLPSGPISAVLWPLGLSLLHTGVVIDDREYSYGAFPFAPQQSPPIQPQTRTNKPATSLPPSFEAVTSISPSTGVFWTRPRVAPPGARFRCSILHGIAYLSRAEIDRLVKDSAGRFRGAEYSLLGNNCNHFTDHLCRVLTRRGAPPWINRAARMGRVVPCLVPAGWADPVEDDDGSETETDADTIRESTEEENRGTNYDDGGNGRSKNNSDSIINNKRAERDAAEESDYSEDEEDEEAEEEEDGPATTGTTRDRRKIEERRPLAAYRMVPPGAFVSDEGRLVEKRRGNNR